MKKFNSLLSIEMQKIFKTKFIYIMVIVLLLISLIMVGAYEMINSIGIDLEGDAAYESPQAALQYYDGIIEEVKAGVNNGSISNAYYENVIGNLYRQREYYAYLVNNNLGFNDAAPYSLGSMNMNYIDFTRMISEIALSFSVIVIIVIGSRNMAGEISSGSMKMILIRPVSRSKVMTAKMAAALISGVGIYILFTILGGIYGMARFGLSAKAFIMATESSAAMIPAVGVLAIELLSGLLQLFAFMMLTYCIGVTMKSKVASLAIPLVLLLAGNIIATLLQYVFIGYVEFAFNLNFMQALQPMVQLFKGINVYSMLTITILWVTGLSLLSYYKFRKYTI